MPEPTNSIITVFGGSCCGPDSAEYRDAVAVGRLLAQRGFTVACGGYAGVMEAVSRGAHEAGGEVIGVTLSAFKRPPNSFITRQRSAPDLYLRLRGLIQQSAGYIALRGGVGTVLEVAIVWNHFLTRLLPPRPLVLLGDCWPPLIEAWTRHLALGAPELRWLQFAGSPEEAVARVGQPSGRPDS